MNLKIIIYPWVSIFSPFIFNGKLNGISLLVISMFSDPVYVDGEIDVSYIAKHICDNSVMLPMYELAL